MTKKGGISLLNQNNEQQNMTGSSTMPPEQSFGGHELLDAHEAISSVIESLDHYTLYESHIQDQKLLDILQRQKTFMTQMYNTIVDTFSTGNEPAVDTQSYNMMTGNNVTFGMQPSAPKSPIQTANEINDECISGGMMGHMKALASGLTLASLESTNPILRRIFADSIPNVIEMAYELFIYQNENSYYQVPQLSQQDMQIMLNSFSPTQGMMQQ